MPYKIITAPSEEPVSLAEARYQCRVDGADDDALLTALIVAAREQAEHETGRALCTQTRELVLDGFPEAFVLRGAPIQSLVSLKFLDEAGDEQTLDPQDTLLDKDSEPGYLVPAYGKAWPASQAVPNAVRVRYTCGYGAASAVPQSIKHWTLLAVGAWYAQREAFVAGQATALPDRFWHRLLDPYRLYEAA